MRRRKGVPRILVCCAVAGLAFDANAETYYVTTTGNDDADGLSEQTAWRTLGHATGQVAPGDLVYVKAGDYGADFLQMTTDGAAGAPIVFEGYRDEPGVAPDLQWSYPENTSLDATVMPLIDGGDRTDGSGISVSGRSYVEVRNFQVTNVRLGVSASSTANVMIENIVTVDLGDVDADYSGNGIKVGSASFDTTVKDCVVYNAAAEGISMGGDRNALLGTQVYADDDSTGFRSATDYYVIVYGNENLIEGNVIERVGDLEHLGHGFGIKGDGVDNVFRDNVSTNLSGSFYVRHRGAQNNLFEDNQVIGGWAAILIRDGASNNTFTRMRVEGAYAGVTLLDTTEDEGAQWAGNDNLVTNSVFEDLSCVVDFSQYTEETPAYDNEIVNITVVGSETLACGERPNYGNAIRNSIIVDVPAYETGPFAIDMALVSNDLWNVGFDVPEGGNLEVEPGFVDGDAGDYRLLPESPCVDAADPRWAPDFDVDGVARPWGEGYDLGAHEYFEDDGGSSDGADEGDDGADETGGEDDGDGEGDEGPTPGDDDGTEGTTSAGDTGAADGPAAGGGTDGDADGCGCRSGSGPAPAGVALMLLALVGRRRSAASGSA